MNPVDIIQHLDALCAASGIKGAEILAGGHLKRSEHSSKFIATYAGLEMGAGATPEEAFAALKAKLKTPAELAVLKREQAQALILEAALLRRRRRNERRDPLPDRRG